ncbi:IS3 family transposase [Mangrovicoccus ximenensis]|uniref:IS3 family transposase n=1 Tax=Mangrovicoccus ximenensis TaxID=1911570 RepID=UPI000D385627
MESVFGSLENGLVCRTRLRSRREAKAALFECIAIFNKRRRHSNIGERPPAAAGRRCWSPGRTGRTRRRLPT